MKFVVFALVLAGCIVGEPGPAPGGGGGGSGSGNGSGSGSGSSQLMPDAGSSLPACTGAIYDPCTDPAQCTSQKCQLFQQSGFQVCTQTCTPGDPTTCPQQNGQAAQCNNMGICKPAAANGCAR